MESKIKGFQQFILERTNYSFANYYSKALNTQFFVDTEVLHELSKFDALFNYMEEQYYFNREGQHRTGEHYAINMKIHVYPQLEKWAKAKGEYEEEYITDDNMYNDWYQFMEDTFEMTKSDWYESYDWIKMIGVGGKSNGWLLLYPERKPTDIIYDLEQYADDYINLIDNLDTNALSQLASYFVYKDDPDTIAMIKLGVAIFFTDNNKEQISEILKYRNILIEYLLEILTLYSTVNTDIQSMINEIKEFSNKAEEYFYIWVKEKYS